MENNFSEIETMVENGRENILIPWFIMLMMMSLLNRSITLPGFDCEKPLHADVLKSLNTVLMKLRSLVHIN